MSGSGVLWRIAWRNLWRHRGRTAILGSVVALTYGFSLAGMGMGDDGHQRMLDEAVKAAGGDILVHGKGYWVSRSSDVVIDDADSVLAAVHGVEGVRAALPRVLVSGLVATAQASRPVLLQGVDPQGEEAWHDVAADVKEGTFLTGDARDPLVLGKRLVERLGLEMGDRVVLTATDPEGDVTRALFHLTGVLQTGTREIDEGLGYTTLAAARRAVGMDGRLTQVGVLLEPGADVDTVAARIRGALGPRAAGLEVLTWREAVPQMVGYVELDNAFGYIYMVVIFVVVLFAITNTFLMAVMERVRELGLLSALGLKEGRIARLILAETVLLTAVAMVAGLALGLGAHLALQRWGINMAAFGLSDVEVSGIDMSSMMIHSVISPWKWALASVLVAVASVASALYPAWRATRLAPAEAMRFSA